MAFQLLSRSAAAAAASHSAAAGSAASAAAHPSSLRLVGLVRRVQREALHARVEFRPARAVRSCKCPHTGGAPTVRERESARQWRTGAGRDDITVVGEDITGGGQTATVVKT